MIRGEGEVGRTGSEESVCVGWGLYRGNEGGGGGEEVRREKRE